ncbi:ATP-binding protein [Glaesserella parasuis]
MEQILLNLLDNAVKYSLPETPIAVQVRLEGDQIGLTVENW